MSSKKAVPVQKSSPIPYKRKWEQTSKRLKWVLIALAVFILFNIGQIIYLSWPKKTKTKIIPLTAEQIIDKLREHHAKQRDTILIERINNFHHKATIIEKEHQDNIERIDNLPSDQLQSEFSNLDR